LIVLGLALFLGFGALYLSGISLQSWFLGWEGAGGRRVGALAEGKGPVRRMMARQTEFRDLQTEGELYDSDTLVTSQEGGARLALDDGSEIELGPSTMVKLVFDSDLSLQGIRRRATIELVTGQVSGTAKSDAVVVKTPTRQVRLSELAQAPLVVKPAPPPSLPPSPRPTPAPSTPSSPLPVVSPSPSPMASPSVRPSVRLISPKKGQVFRVPEGQEELSVAVPFGWTVLPPESELPFSLAIQSAKASAPRELLKKAQAGKVIFEDKIQEPGLYRWRVGTDAVSEFRVDPEVRRIQVLHPLVAGAEVRSNEYEGEAKQKFEGITLRWEPVPGAKTYRVRIFRKMTDRKPLLDRQVNAAEYSFNKGRVFTGEITYQVSTPLPGGWIAVSAPTAFSFDFLAPALVIPEDGAVVTQSSVARSDNSILMTWQKMNFTVGYELEIASDAGFRKIVQRHQSKENFFILKGLPQGKYWWRVRCYSKTVSSPFSRPNLLSISP
jgi:hypothetical protein